MDIFQRTGKKGMDFIRYILVLFALLYLSIKVIWTNRDLGQRDFIKQVLIQIYFTGVQAILPVTVVAVLVGTSVIVSTLGGLGGVLSGGHNIGKMVTVIIIREIAPLMTGGLVIVRSITAITTELGYMRVQREIEALESMGISPVRHLLTPRIFGGLFSLFGLNVVFNAVALIIGFVLAQFLVSLSGEVFFSNVFSAITPMDLIGLFLKIGVGGTGIFLIACYHGMSVGLSSSQVPVEVSKASLNSLVFLLTVNFTVSFLMLLYHDKSAWFGGLV
ncbi:MAG: ABC transporter permease [Deltaproteobacteria bacterium]|nr:ABC transporter permease [Deltaproteobacteria bacterium]